MDAWSAVPAAGGAAGPGTRGDLPGADWQRASDVRGRGTPRGRGRLRAPELRERVDSGPSLGLDLEADLRVSRLTPVDAASQQRILCPMR